jgi:hypothetical protein
MLNLTHPGLPDVPGHPLADLQPELPDTTAEEIGGQVDVYLEQGQIIHVTTAQAIAAWWTREAQSVGAGESAWLGADVFALTGAIIPGFVDTVNRHVAELRLNGVDDDAYLWMAALRAYLHLFT